MFCSVSYAVQCSLVLVGEVFTFVCKQLCSFCADLAYGLGGGISFVQVAIVSSD